MLEVIGSGGYGTTVLAEDAAGARVAVKVLHGSHVSDVKTRQRFAREVEAGRRLRSQYFARLLDFDVNGRQPWIAFSYVEGQGLDQLLHRSRLSQPRARALGGQLIAALLELSRAGLIHRDLKPQNIRVGPNDALTVLDLGIAASPDWSSLTSGQPIGSWPFMAPEYQQGAEATSAVDVYACGLILAQLTGGTFPFTSPNGFAGPNGPAALLEAKRRGNFDLSSVPADVRPLIKDCLHPNSKRRPTAEELLRRAQRVDGLSAPLGLAPVPAAANRRGGARWAVIAASGVAVASVATGVWLWPQIREQLAQETPVDAGPSQNSEPTPLASDTPTPTATPTRQARVSAIEMLYGQVDPSTSRGLPIGAFVPQISSKCEGLTTVDLLDTDGSVGLDGRPESYAPGITEQQIADFHVAMNDRVAEDLIIVKDEPTEDCSKPRMWRVLVDYEASTRDGAQAWCETNGFPVGECLPQQWTESLAASAELEPRYFGQSVGSPMLLVPYWMDWDTSEDAAVLVDPATGGKLTVSQYDVGETPPSLEELVQLARQGSSERPQSWETRDGFIYTGVAAGDTIYYGRRASSSDRTVDILWQYPAVHKARFDTAVGESVVFG